MKNGGRGGAAAVFPPNARKDTGDAGLSGTGLGRTLVRRDALEHRTSEGVDLPSGRRVSPKMIVSCVRHLNLHLMRDVPGRLRGRNARRTNQPTATKIAPILPVISISISKTVGPVQQPARTDALPPARHCICE